MYTASSSPQPLNETSSEKRLPFGVMFEDEVGRVFRYCRNGAVALTAGFVCQSAAAQSSSWSRSLASAKRSASDGLSGGDTVNISMGSLPTENQWTDGFVAFGTAAQGPNTGIIAGHDTSAATTDFTMRHRVVRGQNLVDAGSIRAGVVVSPYNGVVITETDMTRPPVCVAQWSVPVNHYFWGLVRGLGVARCDAQTIVAGDMVMPSNATAGTVEAYALSVPAGTDAAGGTLTVAQQFPIGWCMQAASTYTSVGVVLFNLP